MASPQSEEVHYIKVRPVPRLQDESEIIISPETAERDTTEIILSIKPKLRRLAVRSSGFRIRAHVEIPDNNNRLNLVQSNSTENQNIWAKSDTAEDLVFTYKRKNNTDYDPLNFKVTLEYSLANCTDTYQNPCPVFDSEDEDIVDQVHDKEGKMITKTMKPQTLNFNICKKPHSCQCDVSADIKPTKEIIAGAEETIRLGSLTLSNTGKEASYKTRVNVTIQSEANLKFPWTEDGNCRTDRQNGIISRSCNIFVNKSNEKPIEVIPVTPIKTGVDMITVSLSVMDHCKGQINTNIVEPLNIPVVHHWTLKPELSAGKDSPVRWFYESQEKTLFKSLDYTVTNEGPSMSTKTHLYVYLPIHRLISRNRRVQFDGEICAEGDKKYHQTPPAVFPSSGEDVMQISCTMRGNCLVYKCPVNQTEKNGRKTLRVSYEFKQKEAVEAEEFEGVTDFSVVTSVCVQQADQSKICSKAGETLTTISEFTYEPASTLDLILSNWQILVAVAATILVLVGTLLLAWKFDLFQRARIIRTQGEGETTLVSENEVEMT